jgi:hypothetical protein
MCLKLQKAVHKEPKDGDKIAMDRRYPANLAEEGKNMPANGQPNKYRLEKEINQCMFFLNSQGAVLAHH